MLGDVAQSGAGQDAGRRVVDAVTHVVRAAGNVDVCTKKKKKKKIKKARG
jgi:hypothetical protein